MVVNVYTTYVTFYDSPQVCGGGGGGGGDDDDVDGQFLLITNLYSRIGEKGFFFSRSD